MMNSMCNNNMGRFKMLGLMVLLSIICSSVVNATVSFDDKAFIINGKRRILISGSIHYPRSTPEMWPDLIQKAKAGGLDVIQTYVFWNVHEPSPGQYDFGGKYDLVKFIKVVQQAGLYVHLRIGPYACAEWNLGGFPVWLKYVPGIAFRTDNGPFKEKMQGFVEKVVNIMKFEKLFEPQGGPIIMSQIENEYGNVEKDFGPPGKAYTQWAASMAVGLNTGVPWIMCQQEDAPDSVIPACNGFYCHDFKPRNPTKPKMFTELWAGWFTSWGGAIPKRPAEDVAFAVARFVQNNGSFFNYYMFHGGSNFGRIGSGLFIVTSYDYDAPIDEYGLPNEPKYSHLTNLHKAIKLSEPALASSYPVVTWPAKNQEVHVFRSKDGACAAFLTNLDTQLATKVSFENTQYDLPPWSISILPDCKTVAHNTATAGKPIEAKFLPVGSGLSWQSSLEATPSATDTDTTIKDGLWEQVSVTKDTSDYLWYMTEINIAPGEGFLKTAQGPLLTVTSAGHFLHVFINGQLAGTAFGHLGDTKASFSQNVKLTAGINKISLCSATVGLANYGAHFETWNSGILGPVTLSGLNGGVRDLTKEKWTYKVGLKGEALKLGSDAGAAVQWVGGPSLAQKQPFTWYKATFDGPPGNEPLALNMSSMGKGLIWINGEIIGRHWPANIAKDECPPCNYAGTYTEKKCRKFCGMPSQTWYHVPRSWVKPSGNMLVVFEELGGNPSNINFVKRVML